MAVTDGSPFERFLELAINSGGRFSFPAAKVLHAQNAQLSVQNNLDFAEVATLYSSSWASILSSPSSRVVRTRLGELLLSLLNQRDH